MSRQMRKRVPTFGDLTLAGRIIYGLGFAALLILMLMTLVFGSLATTLTAGLLLFLYVSSAPFVIGGRWRAPKPQPSRRPVVRRRRT